MLKNIIKRYFVETPGSTPATLTPEERDFHLEEYRQIRAELVSLLSRVETIFRYTIIASATVYAWLIAQALGLKGPDVKPSCLKLAPDLLAFAWWIPPALICITSVLAAGSYWRVIVMGSYLLKLENGLGNSGFGLGWEKHNRDGKPVMTSITILAWVLLLGSALWATHLGVAATDSATIACPADKSSR